MANFFAKVLIFFVKIYLDGSILGVGEVVKMRNGKIQDVLKTKFGGYLRVVGGSTDVEIVVVCGIRFFGNDGGGRTGIDGNGFIGGKIEPRDNETSSGKFGGLPRNDFERFNSTTGPG